MRHILILLLFWTTPLLAGPCLKSSLTLMQLLQLAADDPVTLIEQSQRDLLQLRDRRQPAAAWCALALGLAHMNLHDISVMESPAAFELGARVAHDQKLGDVALVLDAMALAWRFMQDEKPDRLLIQQLLQKVADYSTEAQVLSQVLLYNDLDPHDRAVHELKLQRMAEDLRLPLLLRVFIHEDLSYAIDHRKFPERAIPSIQLVWDGLQALPLRFMKANTAYNLGIVHIYRKSPEGDRAAHELLKQSWELSKSLPHSSLHGSVLIAQATLLHRRGQTAAALRTLKAALAYFKPDVDREWLGEAHGKAATIYVETGQWNKALDAIAQVRRILPESMVHDHLVIRELEARALFGLRDYPRAYEALLDATQRLRTWQEKIARDAYESEAARLGLQAEEEKTRALTAQKEIATGNLRLEAMKTRSLRLQLGQRLGLAALLLLLTGLSLGISVKVIRNLIELRRMNHYLATHVLQRFLPPQVIRDVLEGRMQLHDQPEQRLVTALFVDIVSFTAATETLGTTEISRILNRFMIATTRETFACNGLIERYVGDAVMIVFGDTGSTQASDQARQAFACAEGILKQLEAINRELSPDLPWRLEVRMGIHQGLAVVGNIGHAARMEYMALGEAVDVAHKLQEEAEPGEILISRPMTWHLSRDRYMPRASHRVTPAAVEIFILKKGA
ncbi:adenylate/guanylate cyclase domain-containing protein [Oligoflexus tunisiensis]|uniref:adenylate/guanylate cyclase domain-containing protein n=1 Tax=Oligoflexus tunisiensis TaxID=708132 RepID=UPI00114D1426|nr:adenylate/guanylate cyclase domain-containing protein [Oligoflexus tunisiensis]